MKLKALILLIPLLFNCFIIKAQKKSSALDSLFEGGEAAYMGIALKTLQMPRNQLGGDVSGYVIYEISVDTSGAVSAKLMTRLNDDFELEIVKLMQATIGGWLVQSHSYKIYQPIFFGSSTKGYDEVYKEIPSYLKEFGFPVLPPLSVEARMGSTTTRVTETRRVVSRSGQGAMDPPMQRSVSTSSSSPRITTLEDGIKDYKKTMERFEKQLEKGKADKAFDLLTELIRFNPFDTQLIYKRMEMARQTQNTEYMSYDTPWLLALRRMGR